MRVVLSVVAAGFFVGAAHAPAQVIQGRVLDDDAGAAVPGAQVVILGDEGGSLGSAVTDDVGAFAFVLLNANTVTLRISRIGYAAYTSQEVEVRDDEVVQVVVRLGVNAVPLSPLTVLVPPTAQSAQLREFDARRQNPARAGGYFLTREDMDRRGSVTTTQLLRELPGVSLRQVITADNAFGLDRSLVTLPGTRAAAGGGGCLANVFIDGVHMRQGTDHTIDDILDPASVAGVEVYPRAASVPLAYQVDSSCGAVLMWTARPQEGGRGGTRRVIAGASAIGVLLLLGFVIG
jgi:carboxypeptidase family protein/TonB-dependent receptor-like protein